LGEYHLAADQFVIGVTLAPNTVIEEFDRMPFFKSLPENAGPPSVFATYPELYGPWSEMSQLLMNGASPLSPAERELILAFAAGTAGCTFVYVAHSEVAYEWGIEDGLLDRLIDDLDSAPIEQRLKPILAFVRKLILAPKDLTQADADAVFSAGWEEKALHDAIAISARASFMQRLVEGYGFVPLSREVARRHAEKRVKRGYVNLYPAFAKRESE
jgi:alkylhydroperoxidase family enzyme